MTGGTFNEETKREVDIFQDSHENHDLVFKQASDLSSALRTQPKVDFNLDAEDEDKYLSTSDRLKYSSKRHSLGGMSAENRISLGSAGNTQQKSILRQTGTMASCKGDENENSAIQKRRNVQFELEPSPFKVASNATPLEQSTTPTNQLRTSNQYRNPWDLLGRDQHDLASPRGTKEATTGPNDGQEEDTINQRTFG